MLTIFISNVLVKEQVIFNTSSLLVVANCHEVCRSWRGIELQVSITCASVEHGELLDVSSGVDLYRVFGRRLAMSRLFKSKDNL